MVTTVDLSPVDDSGVWADFPDSNYGSDLELRVSHSRISIAYLKFDLSSIPTDSVIQAARLKLYAKTYVWWGKHGHPEVQPTIRVHSVLNNEWAEKTIIFKNAPPITEAHLDSQVIKSEDAEYSFDVKAFVEDQWAKGEKIVSLALTALQADSFLSGIRVASKEDSPKAPRLQISYEPK